MSIFENYKYGSLDEVFDENGELRSHWRTLVENLNEHGLETLSQKQNEIDWQLEENDVTYNVYNDQKRKWTIDPIPFVVSEEEWNELKEGIKQRAKLLNLILKDIYSEQKLFHEGIVPSEVLYVDSHFIREAFLINNDQFNLYFYVADISRGPDGKFWVIADKTDSPSGLGYAIENRLVMNSVNSEYIKNIFVHKLAGFVKGLKNTFRQICKEKDPFVVMLSPGPYSETYFDQSYFSDIIDCELILGDDLLVKDSFLYLKTLSGLKKVDVLIRRVDDIYCDPLELLNESRLGVVGLMDVLRKKNVLMINPIGVGVLENSALNPFMNSICNYFLNEDLIIPQIATWWCGQENEMKYVFEHFDDLIIKSVDKRKDKNVFIVSNLSTAEKENLKKKIRNQPYLYIAQEKVEFSSLPLLENGKIEKRKNSIRVFSYLKKHHENEYEVMNGGLVRTASNPDAFVVSNQKGAGSKDLWVLSSVDEKVPKSLCGNSEYMDGNISIASLTTKKAENIFWLGRYLQRSFITTRMLRIYIKESVNLIHSDHTKESEYLMEFLAKAITNLTMSYPGFFDEKVHKQKELDKVLYDYNTIGTLANTLLVLSNSNLNIKNLLSNECSKVFDKIEKHWMVHSRSNKKSFFDKLEALDQLLLLQNAYKQLLKESFGVEQGMVFYKVGSHIETFFLAISKMQSLILIKQPKSMEHEILSYLLQSYESTKRYKAYYKSNVELDKIVDFLIFNEHYQKSLIYLAKRIARLLESIYDEVNVNLHPNISKKYLDEIVRKLDNTDIEFLLQEVKDEYVYKKLSDFLNDIMTLLLEFSNEFSKNYFTHYYE